MEAMLSCPAKLAEESRLIEAKLEPRGLLIQIVVDQAAEARELQELIDTLWKERDGNG